MIDVATGCRHVGVHAVLPGMIRIEVLDGKCA